MTVTFLYRPGDWYYNLLMNVSLSEKRVKSFEKIELFRFGDVLVVLTSEIRKFLDSFLLMLLNFECRIVEKITFQKSVTNIIQKNVILKNFPYHFANY